MFLGFLLLALPSTAAASPPAPTTQPVDGITASSAVLHGKLTSVDDKDWYRFAYGTSTYYGSLTPTVTLRKAPSLSVSATITGLTVGKTYHVRLIVGDSDDHLAFGADVTFVATAPSTPAPTTLTPSAPAPMPPAGDDPAPGPAPEPQLGQSVVVGVDQGTVKVRAPGQSGFTELSGTDSIPVGALVDTRAGTVALQTATANGPQTASLHGALFEVRQAASDKGMTELRLRGAELSCGSAPRASAAAAQRRRPTVRRLWAHDEGGRFRTRGRNSVATVRGTSWVTTETCAGTRTTVTKGAVVVHDLHRHEDVTVRAGHSYLARSPR
jgi:hypothetical protein